MKKWENPQLNNLGLGSTKSSSCPYESEALSSKTLFPEFVWGDGKLGCTHWNNNKNGCEHPSYGSAGTCWPCPPVKHDPVSPS